MNILFDQGTPVPLRRALPADSVTTIYEQGWSTLQNGHLLTVAEQAGFDVFITTDQNLKNQQQFTRRSTGVPSSACRVHDRERRIAHGATAAPLRSASHRVG